MGTFSATANSSSTIGYAQYGSSSWSTGSSSGACQGAYRVFHAGMPTPVPVANGGTGATSAKGALSNLGIFYAASLPSSGTDGQICLVPV